MDMVVRMTEFYCAASDYEEALTHARAEGN